MKKIDLFFIFIQIPLDYLAVVLAGIFAYFLRISPIITQWRPVLFQLDLPLSNFIKSDFLVAPLWILFFILTGLYRLHRHNHYFEEFFQIAAASSLGFVSIVIYIFIQQQWFNSRFILLASWILSIFFVWFERIALRQFKIILARYFNIGRRQIVVVGSQSSNKKFISIIKHQPQLKIFSITSNLLDLKSLNKLIKKKKIDDLILTDPNIRRVNFLNLVHFCEDQKIRFKFIPNLFQTLTSNTSFSFLGPFPLVELKQTSLDGWGKIIKRGIDLFGSFFGLIILSPLFLVISFLIKFDSPGPTIIKLKRVSNKKIFFIYKFRSMIKNADQYKKYLLPFNERKGTPFFKMKNDPRVTRLGKFLRKTRLDELPQLINVLKGEMSLVGPRPHQLDEIKKYQRKHRKILNIKPGMTGLAQISGSSDLSLEEEIKLDTYYLENWSPQLDLKILIKTFLIIFKDKSAC